MFTITPLTQAIAARIASRMRRDGFTEADTRDVWVVWDCGTHTNAALASRILQEFERIGLRA